MTSARKPWMATLGQSSWPRREGAAPARPKESITERPQRPQGLGLASERQRAEMVRRLRDEGIQDARVLNALGLVPRHAFVDEGLASRAYENTALPIGHGQTISQPYIVARMTELILGRGPLGKVLEVGTGCGYQAAVLAQVAQEVFSIERIRGLHERARQNLRPLRLSNLRLVYGDGLAGLPTVAPFDAMLVAAAARDLPHELLLQLRVGGRLVAPLGDAEQSLCLIERTGPNEFSRRALEPVRFVPLLPGRA